MKIVLNRSPLGTKLSSAAIEELLAAKRRLVSQIDVISDAYALSVSPQLKLGRADLDLVAVVERLGVDASMGGSEFVVVTIPDGFQWKIGDVCGIEYVKCGEDYYPQRSPNSD